MPPQLETRCNKHNPLPNRLLPRRPLDNVLPHDLPPIHERNVLHELI
jgi:hypothetical protein